MAGSTVSARVAAAVMPAALLLIQAATPGPEAAPAAMTRLVEIRSYNLKPGTRDRFHRLFVEQSLPLLRRHNVDVVAYGPSLHDSDSYFLMRSFAGLEERERVEEAFYGSDEWQKGPRDAVLADIESYTTVVIPLEGDAIQALRNVSADARGGGRPPR